MLPIVAPTFSVKQPHVNSGRRTTVVRADSCGEADHGRLVLAWEKESRNTLETCNEQLLYVMAMIYDCKFVPSHSLEQSAGKCHTLGMLEPRHFLVACWSKDKLEETCNFSDQLLSNVAASQQRA